MIAKRRSLTRPRLDPRAKHVGMIAVCNTTPLRYLIAIDQEHLLGQLFESVVIPQAVHEELTDKRTPDKVRVRMLPPPSWCRVQAVEEQPSEFAAILHRGERQAILLAEASHVDLILIDEQLGRTIALSRGLPVSGTLGVLERADRAGLIDDFPAILGTLKASGFYISELLSQKLLARHRMRDGFKP